MNSTVDFRSKAFLLNHIQSILDFYQPNVLDPNWGFHQNFFGDGQVFDKKSEDGAKCDYHTLGACALVLDWL